MSWQFRGLLGVALVVALSCGPGRDESVKIKEGQNLDDIAECPGLLCPGEYFDPPTEFCGEMHFDYGWSPPLCLPNGNGRNESGQIIPNICNRLDCVGQGKKCAAFDGVPVQVYCIDDD